MGKKGRKDKREIDIQTEIERVKDRCMKEKDGEKDR